MIGLTLGLFLLGGVISIFIATQQANRATDSLSRIQENARMAFELTARDIREAGGNPCNRSNPVANVLKDAEDNPWSNWVGGITGYSTDAAFNAAFPAIGTGTGAGQHIAGTHALTVMGASGTSLSVVEHQPKSAQFKVNTKEHGINDGDILMACDFGLTSIFQVTNANASNVTIVHNTGGSVSPGNCTKGLGLPVTCTTNGTEHTFGPNSQLVRFVASTWYVGASGRNDTSGNPINSLFRIVNNGAALEMIEGVDNMQLSYLVRGANTYVAAPAATAWPNVTAVRIVLTLSGTETGTRSDNLNNNRLQRTVTQIITLRSRQS
ncbi:MAG: hypothetical protein B7Y40_09185 [Gammaproteobacteria bacterium 28-57-27]|nr:MAG: hypothetical protein B7Y40_09185 [Gammaproteobacteria bacterium 28-57-27]